MSCNFAVLDMLLNWACHARGLGLKFVLLAMDHELFEAATGPRYRWLLPHCFIGAASPEGFRGTIDPHTHNAWRNGQFNVVSLYKVAAVTRVLNHGYSVKAKGASMALGVVCLCEREAQRLYGSTYV